jgi:hypothetical protein
MSVKIKINYPNTNDKVIRTTLKGKLEEQHKYDPIYRIIEELGVNHGSARVDIAVVNGVMHGYEIKSDRDTLQRLPEQIKAYNAVFNKMTIVVGLSHLYEAIYLVPDWWGVTLARTKSDGSLQLSEIRQADQNLWQDNLSLARLLWRDEALTILESLNVAKGVRTKTRSIIYERLAGNLDKRTLNDKVREKLCFRPSWRVDQKLQTNDGLVQL